MRYADSVHTRNALPTAKAARVTHRPGTVSASHTLRHLLEFIDGPASEGMSWSEAIGQFNEVINPSSGSGEF